MLSMCNKYPIVVERTKITPFIKHVLDDVSCKKDLHPPIVGSSTADAALLTHPTKSHSAGPYAMLRHCHNNEQLALSLHGGWPLAKHRNREEETIWKQYYLPLNSL